MRAVPQTDQLRVVAQRGQLWAFGAVHITICEPFQVNAIGTLRSVPSLSHVGQARQVPREQVTAGLGAHLCGGQAGEAGADAIDDCVDLPGLVGDGHGMTMPLPSGLRNGRALFVWRSAGVSLRSLGAMPDSGCALLGRVASGAARGQGETG